MGDMIISKYLGLLIQKSIFKERSLTQDKTSSLLNIFFTEFKHDNNYLQFTQQTIEYKVIKMPTLV